MQLNTSTTSSAAGNNSQPSPQTGFYRSMMPMTPQSQTTMTAQQAKILQEQDAAASACKHKQA